MGESSACLVRSFSQPSPTSSDEKKGNTLQRALTTSISFGRFMSESLDWEKWSAFTHNRHLEEVEKYSKPGSVAEKKAYFEAHFKRRRAAALLEQQNAAANDLSETNTEIPDKDKFSSGLDLAQRDSCAVIENMKDVEVQNSGPVSSPVGQNVSYDFSSERTLEDGTEKVIGPPVLTESPVELTRHLEKDEQIGDVVSKKDNEACNEDDSNMTNSPSLSEKKIESSSSKLSANGSVSKCAHSVKPVIPIQLRNSDKVANSKNNALDSGNKRRSYTTSLHASINVPSCSGETQKASSPGLPKIANSRLVRAPAKKYKNNMVPQISNRASVSGIFKHHSAAPPAENKRTVTPQGNSNLVRRTVDWKVHSPSSDYSKSSNTFEGKARLPTASSPFKFKSEERAEKRKEFFQKLEQKLKSKETEKHELHAKSQVKARSTVKDLSNSFLSKAMENAEVPPKIKLPSNIKKKISTEIQCFPRIEERAFKVEDNNSRPPWRLSTKTTQALKDVAGNNRCYLSGKCFSKKTNENASPNIH